MLLQYLLEDLDYEEVIGNANINIGKIEYDSKKIEEIISKVNHIYNNYKKIIDLPNPYQKNHNVDRKRAVKLPYFVADPNYILQSTSENHEDRFVIVTNSKGSKKEIKEFADEFAKVSKQVKKDGNIVSQSVSTDFKKAENTFKHFQYTHHFTPFIRIP